MYLVISSCGDSERPSSGGAVTVTTVDGAVVPGTVEPGIVVLGFVIGGTVTGGTVVPGTVTGAVATASLTWPPAGAGTVIRISLTPPGSSLNTGSLASSASIAAWRPFLSVAAVTLSTTRIPSTGMLPSLATR